MVMDWPQLFLAFCLSFLVFFFVFRDRNGHPTNWPVLGMLPALVINMHRIYDWCCEILDKSPVTFQFRSPWFVNMDMLLTGEPSNVDHVMRKNYANYPKGGKLQDTFDIFGEYGIFNADVELWKYHRSMAQSFLTLPNFNRNLINKVWEKTEKGLIPILENASKQGLVVDLQDLFERFTFDTFCTLFMGRDFEALSINLPECPSSKALNDAEKAILYRHVIPVRLWKFMRWLGVGIENKHKQACKVLDEFVYKCIALKREEMDLKLSNKHEEGRKEDSEVGDLLTAYMLNREKSIKGDINTGSDKFLRDTILNFFIAGRGTISTALSWFFYLLSKNPNFESKIRQELNLVVTSNLLDNFDQLSGKLVYLHASLCETLRLYPPVAFEDRSPAEPDILPSGHKVSPSTQILINLYAMARSKSLWGENCHEFFPERWISKDGTIRHEASSKFLTFNTGPRACQGKNMAFTQMKLMAAIIIQKYRIQLAVEDHLVTPAISIIIHMKHGLKVKVLPRNI